MARRLDRINVLLRQEISRVISSELRDPRLSLIVSVTRVDTSADMRHAKVFVSVLGSPSEKQSTLKGLKSAAGFIHRDMRHNLKLRSVPSLYFQLDQSIELAAEFQERINEAAPRSETDEKA